MHTLTILNAHKNLNKGSTRISRKKSYKQILVYELTQKMEGNEPGYQTDTNELPKTATEATEDKIITRR